MFHSPRKFPSWVNTSRLGISRVFAPFSGAAYISLAKMFRGEDVVVGNCGPVVGIRNRRKLHPKKRSGRNLHGRACVCCNPRQGVPRKPYNRASMKAAPLE